MQLEISLAEANSLVKVLQVIISALVHGATFQHAIILARIHVHVHILSVFVLVLMSRLTRWSKTR